MPSSNDIIFGPLVMSGIVILLVFGVMGRQAYLDSQDHRYVKVNSKIELRSSSVDAQGQIQPLYPGQVPTGDFQVLSFSTDSEKPFVGDVNNSFVRWGKEQRAETYLNLQSAIQDSAKNGCSYIRLEIQGTNANLPIPFLGKSYPVVLSAKPGC